MVDITKRLAEALEAFVEQAESAGQHDDVLEYAKQALEEYRNIDNSARQELVPLSENKLAEFIKQKSIDEPNRKIIYNVSWAKDICSTFGTKQVSVEDIEKVILDCGFTNGNVTKLNAHVVAKELYTLI